MKTNKVLADFWPEIVLSLLIIIIFLISVDIYQYLITEIWWLRDEIDNTHTSIYFLFLIFIFSMTPIRKLIIKNSYFSYFIILIFTLVLFLHKNYTKFYNETQQYPKIRNISKEWGIPGSWIKINGTNFGEESELGKIFLSDKEMLVKKWNDKEIIFEINMEVGKGIHNLKVLKNNNKEQKQDYKIEVK